MISRGVLAVHSLQMIADVLDFNLEAFSARLAQMQAQSSGQGQVTSSPLAPPEPSVALDRSSICASRRLVVVRPGDETNPELFDLPR